MHVVSFCLVSRPTSTIERPTKLWRLQQTKSMTQAGAFHRCASSGTSEDIAQVWKPERKNWTLRITGNPAILRGLDVFFAGVGIGSPVPTSFEIPWFLGKGNSWFLGFLMWGNLLEINPVQLECFRPGLGRDSPTKPLKMGNSPTGDQVVRQKLRRQNQPSWEAKGAPPLNEPPFRENIKGQWCLTTLYLLVVEPTQLKNISQIGSSPQVGMKIKNSWNHHLALRWLYIPFASLQLPDSW